MNCLMNCVCVCAAVQQNQEFYRQCHSRAAWGAGWQSGGGVRGSGEGREGVARGIKCGKSRSMGCSSVSVLTCTAAAVKRGARRGGRQVSCG